jgi:hypothetical protein
MRRETDRHSENACARLLDRFLVDVADIPTDLLASNLAGDEASVITDIGLALWDIFSQNHTVTDADGVAYDLGSWRGSAAFIAECVDRRYPALAGHDYLDFYMGSILGSDKEQLRPMYRWIFAGLKEAECDWIYSFPRLYLVDFSGLVEDQSEMAEYDPSEAVRADFERSERAEQTAALRAEFDHAYEEDVRSAADKPLPVIVSAYRDVYGKLPQGWPHPDM